MHKYTVEAGRKVWLTSDLHISHANILRLCCRPWLPDELLKKARVGEKFVIPHECVQDHDRDLIRTINRMVNKEDLLIIAGDLAYDTNALGMLYDHLLCDEVLVVVGNHDDEQQLRFFFGMSRVFERLLISVRRSDIWSGSVKKMDDLAVIDHYAGDCWYGSHYGSWQLYGHSHGTREASRRANPQWRFSRDVGVDANNYKPLSWQDDILPWAMSQVESRQESTDDLQGDTLQRGKR